MLTLREMTERCIEVMGSATLREMTERCIEVMGSANIAGDDREMYRCDG